jgi:hypothetical protein
VNIHLQCEFVLHFTPETREKHPLLCLNLQVLKMANKESRALLREADSQSDKQTLLKAKKAKNKTLKLVRHRIILYEIVSDGGQTWCNGHGAL